MFSNSLFPSHVNPDSLPQGLGGFMHTDTFTHMLTHRNTHTHLLTQSHTHECIHACTWLLTSISTHAFIHKHTHVLIQTYTKSLIDTNTHTPIFTVALTLSKSYTCVHICPLPRMDVALGNIISLPLVPLCSSVGWKLEMGEESGKELEKQVHTSQSFLAYNLFS